MSQVQHGAGRKALNQSYSFPAVSLLKPHETAFFFPASDFPGCGVMKNGRCEQSAPNESNTMKNTKLVLITAAAVALLASTNQGKAQYNAVGDDGIAASPKLRQFMNERGKPMVKDVRSTQVVSVGYRATGVDGITASPKLRQQIDASRGVWSTPGAVVAKVGYRATGDDGITASPKLRQFLDARNGAYQIAPLK